MRQLISLTITVAILAGMGVVLHWGFRSANYWTFGVAFVAVVWLAFIVADEADKKEARQIWSRFTSRFRL
jgi:predicted membrane channel-forming protein YqfA (hemolysin III family)